MKESKYLEFHRSGVRNGKTEHYTIISKSRGYIIGFIAWYGPWRQYCFNPAGNTVFNVRCMQDIQDFIGELMAERQRVKGA